YATAKDVVVTSELLESDADTMSAPTLQLLRTQIAMRTGVTETARAMASVTLEEGGSSVEGHTIPGDAPKMVAEPKDNEWAVWQYEHHFFVIPRAENPFEFERYRNQDYSWVV